MTATPMRNRLASRFERRRRTRTGVLIAVAAVFLASCAPQPDTTLTLDEALVVADVEGARATAFERMSAVARCMADSGFEYVPHVPSDIDASSLQRYSAYSTPSTFLREHGYGLVQSLQTGLQHASTDPNRDIVDRLTTTDRDAYYEALLGDHGDGGCFADAIGSYLATMDEVGLELGQMMSRFEQDERVVDANRDWAACMDLQGLRYASPEAAKTYIANRIGMLDMGDRAAQLTELQMEELHLAEADADCRIGLDYDLVLSEYEREFEIANSRLVADLARAIQGER